MRLSRASAGLICRYVWPWILYTHGAGFPRLDWFMLLTLFVLVMQANASALLILLVLLRKASRSAAVTGRLWNVSPWPLNKALYSSGNGSLVGGSRMVL